MKFICVFAVLLLGTHTQVLRLGMKVGGSEMKLVVRDYDIGFEVFNFLEGNDIGEATTRLMGCSLNMLRTDAVCGAFESEYQCVNWKPEMYSNGGKLFDYTKTCIWNYGECRGCEMFDTKGECLNSGCTWDKGRCQDVCRQDAWVPLNNGKTYTKGNITVSSTRVSFDPNSGNWTFDGDALGTTYVKVRQIAHPFTARVLKVDVEKTKIGVAAANKVENLFGEPACSDDTKKIENATCETDAGINTGHTSNDCSCKNMVDLRAWNKMQTDLQDCLPCDSGLDWKWQQGQGEGYIGSRKKIDYRQPQFKNIAGGIVLQMPNDYTKTSAGTFVYAKRITSPLFMQFEASHDFRAVVFRAGGMELDAVVESASYPNGGDMGVVPTWLTEGVRSQKGFAKMASGAPVPLGLEGGWTKTTRYDLAFEGTDGSRQIYVGFYRDFKARDQVYLGGSAYGLGLEDYTEQSYLDGRKPKTSNTDKVEEKFADPNQYPNHMYVVVLRGRVEVTAPAECDLISVNYVALVTASMPFVLLFVPAVVYVWWFMHHKLRYRLDHIPSYLVSMTLSDENKKRNILGAILLSYHDTSDPTHRYFRRSLYWVEMTIWVLMLSPLVLWTAWALTLIITITPRTLGVFWLFFGNAVMISVASVLQWRAQGWRMTRGVQRGLQVSFALLLVYQMVVALLDPCGMTFFGITAAHLVINMVLMVYVNFLNSHHVEDAFVEIESHSTDVDEVMASIMASLGEDTNKHSSGLRGYLQGCYSIDNGYDSFALVDELNTHSKGKNRKVAVKSSAKNMYFLAAAVLIMYLAISRFFLTQYDRQAFANVCTVLFLDATVPLLQQGNLTWSPLFTSILMLLSRVVITGFSGEYWIAGHSLAYFVFGVAIAFEIVDQRLPEISGLDAGAAAYFDRKGETKTTKARSNNISSSPEMVFGYILSISILFLVIGNYTVGTGTSFVFLSARWPVWSVGVGLVIINLEILLLLATVRSLRLYSRNLLNTEAYCCVPSYRLPFVLATALVVFTILSGVLLTLFSGSTMFVVFSFFVPLIVLTGGYSWSNYSRNDCSFTLTELRRQQEIEEDHEKAQKKLSDQLQKQEEAADQTAGGGGGGGSSPFRLPGLGSTANSSLSKLKMPKLPMNMPSMFNNKVRHARVNHLRSPCHYGCDI